MFPRPCVGEVGIGPVGIEHGLVSSGQHCFDIGTDVPLISDIAQQGYLRIVKGVGKELRDEVTHSS